VAPVCLPEVIVTAGETKASMSKLRGRRRSGPVRVAVAGSAGGGRGRRFQAQVWRGLLQTEDWG